MPGTATLPAGDDAVPGAVLVHGSEPADADLTIGATRTFQDLAEGLASHGVATLRYDKRSFACPHALTPETHTLETDLLADAEAAIETLAERDGVDENRLFAIGWSLGGAVVPTLVDRVDALAGGAALAAPYRPFHELLLDQYEYLATVGDREWAAAADRYRAATEAVDRVREGAYEPDERVLDVSGAFWDSLASHDHVEAARSVAEPLSYRQGERDYQVTTADDFEPLRAALADRPDTTFDAYEGSNHLFMPGRGPSTPFEYELRNDVDARVVEDLVDWVAAVTE